MNESIFQGIILVLLMGAFIGLWIWAWSSKRKSDFEEAASLPLEDEDLDENSAGEGRP